LIWSRSRCLILDPRKYSDQGGRRLGALSASG